MSVLVGDGRHHSRQRRQSIPPAKVSGQGGAHGQAVNVIKGAKATAFERAPEVTDEDLGPLVQEHLVPAARITAGSRRGAWST